jgi:hypothetical protein
VTRRIEILAIEDDASYEYQDDLTGLLRAYVRSNRDQFPK